MAEIPTLTVPEAQPRATPAPDIRLQTPADAFGAASAGQSLEKQGAAAGQAADANFAYAKAFQDLNNKAASDTAGSEFAAKSREMYNQWSLANPGAKALTPSSNGLTPFDQFSQDLGTLRNQTAAKYGLSKVGTSLYDDQTRRLQALVLGDADSYARTQQHAYWISASKAKVETLQNQMTQRPTDLNFLSGIHDQIAQEVAHQQTLTGMSDDEAALQTMNSSSEGLRTVVSGLGVHDPAAAADLLKTYEAKGWIAPKDQDALDRTLHGPLVAQGAAQAATAAFSGVGSGTAGDIKSAILGQESGNNSGVGHSSAGAIGPGQIEPDTFKRFALPGERIDNPTDNRAVSARMIDHFSQEYNGDPARIAVAYFSGEGNVAPVGSPTPWKRDAHDPDGTTVSQYVAGVTSRAGGNTPGNPPTESSIAAIEANLPAIQQDAKGRADAWAAKYGIDKSEMETAVTEHTQQQYSKAKYTYDQQQTADKGALLTTMEQGDGSGEPISDMTSLLKDPTSQAAFARLTPADQNQIRAQVAANGNVWSVNRSNTAQTLIGESQNDPLGFTNRNLTDPSLDLRRADRIGLLKRQAETREQLQRGGLTDTQKWLHSALNVPSIQLNLPKDPGQQNQFVGALTSKLESWQAANPGKVPSLNDYNSIGQELLTSTGGFVGIGGHPVYQDIAAQRATVPENFRAFQRAYAATHGVPQPAEAQIEAAWQKAQH